MADAIVLYHFSFQSRGNQKDNSYKDIKSICVDLLGSGENAVPDFDH